MSTILKNEAKDCRLFFQTLQDTLSSNKLQFTIVIFTFTLFYQNTSNLKETRSSSNIEDGRHFN